MMCGSLTHVKCKWAPLGFTRIPPVLCCGFRVSHNGTHGSPMGRHGHPVRP
ncbi:unnamed protein product, partial [Ectocarpus sp. 8 AP-2014]